MNSLIHYMLVRLGLAKPVIADLESIIAPLAKISARLEAHADALAAKAEQNTKEATRLDEEAYDLRAAASKAIKQRTNIARLLGDN